MDSQRGTIAANVQVGNAVGEPLFERVDDSLRRRVDVVRALRRSRHWGPIDGENRVVELDARLLGGPARGQRKHRWPICEVESRGCLRPSGNRVLRKIM